MDTFVAGLAADHPGMSDPAERRCGLFGCLEAAVWIVSDPQGGDLPACEADVDVILSDALGRVPLDRDIRAEGPAEAGCRQRRQLGAEPRASSHPGGMDSWRRS